MSKNAQIFNATIASQNASKDQKCETIAIIAATLILCIHGEIRERRGFDSEVVWRDSLHGLATSWFRQIPEFEMVF